MQNLESIKEINLLKILGDETRQRILRILMCQSATLSHIGKELEIHPARVRHHLKQLEHAGLVVLTATNQVRGFVEKYYRASAKAYHVNELIVPVQLGKQVIVATGSHDIALELLATSLCEDQRTPDFMAVPIGSLDGLIALRQGLGQIAGCHLFDPTSNEFNLPYVRMLFPTGKVRIITLVGRQQGLITAPGNPKGIRSIDDLVSTSVRFVNRQTGSGTRTWLDQEVGKKNIEKSLIPGYDGEVFTHREVAEQIFHGHADVGLGLQAVALQSGLDFIPLFDERYDLVIPEDQFQNPEFQPTLEIIHSKPFRLAVEALGGYNTKDSGTEISF